MNSRQPSNVEIDDQDSETSEDSQALTGYEREKADSTNSPPSAVDEQDMIGTGSWKEKNDELSTSTKGRAARRPRRQPWWHCGLLLLLVTLCSISVLFSIYYSATRRQVDEKGCRMSYMWPSYARLEGFGTEHTRFASKYSVYLYREETVDDTSKSALSKPKGVPVLFIPGNAGSYKQVRPIASHAAKFFREQFRANSTILAGGARSLDFFTVDFNEDITAFHGQTMLDQAEYLNDAVAYILSLYHDSRKATKEADFPDPQSVIIVGHSMGGIVARTMLTMPNYQTNSINTIITMSTPHARPPITFDAESVRTYERVNAYWRNSYNAEWASHNPLWHVTLISIAGGGLDTVVPSDYASIASLIPETHGFTVFTSTIPGVWCSMDHLAIMWCDQFRKVLAETLLAVVNVQRPGQTKPRTERMRVFKKKFLTGMEDYVEPIVKENALDTLLTLEPTSQTITPLGETLVLRKLGGNQNPKAHLLPVPPRSGPRGTTQFTLLTDRNLEAKNPELEVLVCSTIPLQAGQAPHLASINIERADDATDGTRLACKPTTGDVVSLPGTNNFATFPFNETAPFSYLQYDLEDIGDHEFVAVVDKSQPFSKGWVMAQFSERAQSYTVADVKIPTLFSQGIHTVLPADRPFMTELHVPVIQSSLLAYKLSVSFQTCGGSSRLFTPLVRQYLSEPYESKYFVNVTQADINLHGIAPFMPEPLKYSPTGLTLQMWTDSTCNTPIEISLKVDFVGSIGKLAVRYRTVFVAFPLLIVALVLRLQFHEYDTTGVFITFSDGLERVVRHSLPAALAIVSLLTFSLALAQSRQDSGTFSAAIDHATDKVAESSRLVRFLKNDTLIGLQDPFFWFLAPIFVACAVGVCAILNLIVLILVHVFATVYSWFPTRQLQANDDRSRHLGPRSPFSSGSPRRRLVVTCILLFSVATVIPYQFAYVVVCIVQLSICIRALKFARESGYGSRSYVYWDFVNYTHSLLVLMLWILPINLPILVVWVHNLAVHWSTPFSSHHNVLSVMPFILLIETLTCGNMIPRSENILRHVTSFLFLGTAVYAAIYGVMYAFMLHHATNLVAAWLVMLHFSGTSFSLTGLAEMFNPPEEPKKLP